MASVHHLCPLKLCDLGEHRRLCQKGKGGTRGCGGRAEDVTVVVAVPGPLGGRAVRACAGGVGLSTGIVSGCLCVHTGIHVCAHV